jgi:hypothetical protein
MRRFNPLFLILGCVLPLFGGFIYDILFAGIPYQDPTPELSASYALHANIASMICWFGAVVFLIGWVTGIRRFWPILFIIGGGHLVPGGFVFAAAFASKPQEAYFVHIASITGWCGVAVFVFGVVAGVIRVVTQNNGGSDSTDLVVS